MRLGLGIYMLVLSSCVASVVNAGGPAAYVGAMVGNVGSDKSFTSPQEAPLTRYDVHDNASKLIVGVRPLDWFAAEVSVIAMGEIVPEDLPRCCDFQMYSTSLDAIGVVGVFTKRTNIVDLSLRTGVARWKSDGVYSGGWSGGRRDVSASGTDLLWGVGLQRFFGKLAVRADYDLLDLEIGVVLYGLDSFQDSRVASLGVTWDFN